LHEFQEIQCTGMFFVVALVYLLCLKMPHYKAVTNKKIQNLTDSAYKIVNIHL